jgi:hypothetical protein
VRLSRFLLAGLDGQMMSHRTAGDGAEHGMMVGEVSGNGADDGSFETTRLARGYRDST